MGIDEQRKKIEIRYVVEDNSSPTSIRNDMSVKLHVEIKKKESGYGMYPLCVHTIDLNVVDSLVFDASTGMVEVDCTISCY